MRFVRFEIENFKGIKSAALDLMPAGSNVFTLIGLNESGKTTILEALDDFGASREGMEALYGAKRVAEFVTYVPKHLKANFTGDITIAALVAFDDAEIEDVIESVLKTTGCRLVRVPFRNSLRSLVAIATKTLISGRRSMCGTWICGARKKAIGSSKRFRYRVRLVVRSWQR